MYLFIRQNKVIELSESADLASENAILKVLIQPL